MKKLLPFVIVGCMTFIVGGAVGAVVVEYGGLRLGGFHPLSAPEMLVTREFTLAADKPPDDMSSFRLSAGRQVRLEVESPRPVDVLLMDDEGFQEYAQAAKSIKGLLFGGKYRYFPELSGEHLKSVERSGKLEAGNYHIVVAYNRDDDGFFNVSTDPFIVHVAVHGL